MTKPSPKQTPSRAILIVFGRDANDRPKAGKFTGSQIEPARKAAEALKLIARDADRPDLQALAKKLPSGRIHAQGKAFLPAIKTELYAQIEAVTGQTPVGGNETKGKTVKDESTTSTITAKPNTSVHAAEVPSTTRGAGKVFVVLGFDDKYRPCGARYSDPNLTVLTNAVGTLGLRLFELRSANLIKLSLALQPGKLLSDGRADVPVIRQALYSDLVSEFSVDPLALACGKIPDLPKTTGCPKSWEAITAGHLVIAQESLDYGWAEAIVIDRSGEMLGLQFRDFPKAPKFYRNYRAVALLHQPTS